MKGAGGKAVKGRRTEKEGKTGKHRRTGAKEKPPAAANIPNSYMKTGRKTKKEGRKP